MVIRGSFHFHIDVSVDVEAAKIERFIVIEIVDKLCSKQTLETTFRKFNTPHCYEKYCLDILDHMC